MPRPKRIRKVINPPHFKGYMPIGIASDIHPVVLNFEEYESIRLCDHELLGQVDAATFMDVSRPTFTRIYESARRKVALAFVTGSPILFEGGKVYYDSDWFFCSKCSCIFNHPEKEEELIYCALCGSTDIGQMGYEDEAETSHGIGLCPRCGYSEPHEAGIPCNKQHCPRCNSMMLRKGGHHRQRNRNQNQVI